MKSMSSIRSVFGSLAILSVAMFAFAPEAVAQEPLSGEPLFIEASVDNDRPYVGQQIAYLFRIFRRSDYSPPAGESLYEPPNFAGFWNSEASERREYSETVGSHEYSVVELRTLLFPTVTGQTEIGAAKLSGPAGILETDSVSVDIRTLPTGAPPGFTGAVGRFEIAVEVNAATIGAGERVLATVRISGEGNVEALPDPEWPEFQRWRLIAAPSHADSRVSNGKLSGVRVYELALAPQEAGQFTIPAIEYAYFDPELERYVQATTSPIAISVVGEADPSEAQSESEVKADDREGAGLRPLMEPPSALGQRGIGLTESPVYWAAWVLPALLVAGVLVWRRRQAALEVGQAESRRRNALANARNALSRASASGDTPAVAAADAIFAYLSDRLGESLTGLTSEGLDQRIRSAGVPDDVAIRVGRAIAEGEAARFAPEGQEVGGITDHIDRATRLLADLEEAFEA